MSFTQLIYLLIIRFVIGTTPSEWTNQEENHDDVAPLAEVQQKLKLRHARTVRTTYLHLLLWFCLFQIRSALLSSILSSPLFYHLISCPFLICLLSYYLYLFSSTSVYLFSYLTTIISLQFLSITGTFSRWEVKSCQNKKCDKCFDYDAYEYLTWLYNFRVS